MGRTARRFDHHDAKREVIALLQLVFGFRIGAIQNHHDLLRLHRLRDDARERAPKKGRPSSRGNHDADVRPRRRESALSMVSQGVQPSFATP